MKIDKYSINGSKATNWDDYYFGLAKAVSRNSKCLSRRIGAVIIKDKSIISSGYNGPARGIPTCNLRWVIDSKFRNKYNGDVINGADPNKICPRKAVGSALGENLEMCVAGHAEENAIVNASRMGICTKDSIMVMNCGIPCHRCLTKIINAGIKEIVVTFMEFYDINSEYIVANSNLKIRTYNFKNNTEI